jgi:hypothetical protein
VNVIVFGEIYSCSVAARCKRPRGIGYSGRTDLFAAVAAMIGQQKLFTFFLKKKKKRAGQDSLFGTAPISSPHVAVQHRRRLLCTRHGDGEWVRRRRESRRAQPRSAERGVLNRSDVPRSGSRGPGCRAAPAGRAPAGGLSARSDLGVGPVEPGEQSLRSATEPSLRPTGGAGGPLAIWSHS